MIRKTINGQQSMLTKFYNREAELERLQSISEKTKSGTGSLTTVIGRRRVGKTALLKKALDGPSFVYLFANKKKSENALIDEWMQTVTSVTNAPSFVSPSSLIEVLQVLIHHAQQTHLTVVIDEFQDIAKIRSDFFADLQNLWDSTKGTAHMHLICCGSVYTLMKKLFEDDREPLFGRANFTIDLQPLRPSYLREYLHDSGRYSSDNLLLYFAITGGIPRYLELMDDYDIDSPAAAWERLISAGSLVIGEGQHRLVDDVGSDRKYYFEILDAIASGKNTRQSIEDWVGSRPDKALDALDTTFNIISKKIPLGGKIRGNTARYEIVDPFLRFWFRFIHKHSGTVEIGNYEMIRRFIARDYQTYSGLLLEQLYREILAESMQFSEISSFWDKSEHDNEIDIIAINKLDKKILIAECKRNSSKYNARLLQDKGAVALRKLEKYGQYEVEYACFALDNLDEHWDRFNP